MMHLKSLRPQALVGLSLAFSACAEPSGAEPVSETASELAASSWVNTSGFVPVTFRGVQVATLNGITYSVSAGSCGGALGCLFDEDENGLSWGKTTAPVNSDAVDIVGQASNSKVSLAAFNGYLYMVHTGGDDGDASTWMSRFDPATKRWTDNFQIQYPSFAGPPAIVVYNDLLYWCWSPPTT